jgi:hypothetical protein
LTGHFHTLFVLFFQKLKMTTEETSNLSNIPSYLFFIPRLERVDYNFTEDEFSWGGEANLYDMYLCTMDYKREMIRHLLYLKLIFILSSTGFSRTHMNLVLREPELGFVMHLSTNWGTEYYSANIQVPWASTKGILNAFFKLGKGDFI